MSGFYGENVSAQQDVGVRYIPVAERRIRPKFLAMVHRKMWDWDETLKMWLPRLNRLVISAGVGGVDMVNGVEDYRPAVANYMSRGYQIIPNPAQAFADILPPDGNGERRGTYLRRWKAQPRGWAYGYVWERPEDVAGDMGWEVDEALRQRFRLAVMERLLGGGPDPRLAAQFVRAQAKIVRRRRDKHATHPHFPQVKTKWEREAQILVDMQGALSKMQPVFTLSAPTPSQAVGPDFGGTPDDDEKDDLALGHIPEAAGPNSTPNPSPATPKKKPNAG